MHKTRKPHFPQQQTKNPLYELKNSIFFRLSAEKRISSSKTTFSQAEIRHESGSVPFDQMKVSKKSAEPKKHQQSMIKY